MFDSTGSLIPTLRQNGMPHLVRHSHYFRQLRKTQKRRIRAAWKGHENE